ncbi:MAG: hypothetical protein M3081_11160 [Gemmatimonadota bacterium]|nr:hypothetical protein [Gemmatimonadota bacterium]
MSNPVTSIITPPNSPGYTPAQLQGAGGKLGKNEFLKLLVAQMRNQDPDKPMDGTQLATQLAQFSSVEQLLNIGTAMDAQSASSSAMAAAISANAAMGSIGKIVTAAGKDVAITNGTPAAVTVKVGGAGGAGTLEIHDGSGALVGTRALGYVPGGLQTIDVGSAQNGLATGNYTYAVKVVSTDKTDVGVTTYTVGKVDGVIYTSAGPILTAGSLSIPFASVVQVKSGS